MLVFDLHRELDTLLNQRALYRTRQQKDDALNFASRGLFGHYYGNIEAYAPDKPLPAVAYAVTQAVNDALRPFERVAHYTQLDPDFGRRFTDGRVPLPADIVHPTSISTPKCLTGIKVTSHDRLRLAQNNPELVPDDFFPLVFIVPPGPAGFAEPAFPGGYRFQPVPTEATITYLGFPPEFKYAVKYEGTREVFDEAKSVNAPWAQAQRNQLLTRAMSYLAMSVRDQQAAGFAAANTQKGD